MSPYGFRICQIGCMAECSHGTACMIYMIDRDHPHPTAKGREQHYGWDGTLMHEWNGAKGKCRTYLPEEETYSDEPITLA